MRVQALACSAGCANRAVLAVQDLARDAEDESGSRGDWKSMAKSPSRKSWMFKVMHRLSSSLSSFSGLRFDATSFLGRVQVSIVCFVLPQLKHRLSEG